MLKVYYSNKIELLYENLKERLFCSSSPFCRRLIIVPSPAVKSWLMIQMANDPEVGIATGIEVAYLDQTIESLACIQKQLSPLELAFSIELKIREVVHSDESSVWQPLFQYLSQKSEQRLIALSDVLANLFRDYQIYGGKMVHEWEKGNGLSWQAELWKEVFRGHSSFSSELLASSPIFSRPTQVHLFSVSFIPRLYHAFFEKVSSDIPAYYYLLSPCQLFWSDILSDRESFRLKAIGKRKGIAEAQQQQLEEYLRDRNPLLANFGRLGREMARQIEESDAQCQELYIFPKGIQAQAAYADQLVDEALLFGNKEELTLLEGVQADMALLRNPESSSPIPVVDSPSSIQVHVSCSKAREVQALYDVLMKLIAQHSHESRPICPVDIIVMSPDIMHYESLIRTTFGSAESQLDYHILDLAMPSLSSTVQAFLHLIELAFGRWDSASLLQLLDYPDFQAAQKLSGEDILILREWIQEVGIYWGGDENHRDEILKRKYASQGFVEKTAVGTWEYGFGRLTAGMVISTNDEDDSTIKVDYLPHEGIDNAQAELLGKWIYLFRSMRQDLAPLINGTQLNLREWSHYLECLARGYLGVDGSKEEHQAILDITQGFSNAFSKFPQSQFGFSTIYFHLQKALSREKISFRETHLQAIRFCSMLPMRTIPAQVIVLMGMHEGAFPRQEKANSLNMLKVHPGVDYRPSQTDFDRYLFLETLLSARRYFILSYQGYAEDTELEQPPALVVTELMAYLDRAFCLGGKKPSEAITWRHPFHAYDAANFQSDSNWRSYSNFHYRAAKAHYEREKLPPHRFIPDFHIHRSAPLPPEVTIDLKQLYAFARNPLKTFFNNTLGMYIKEKTPEAKVQEDLFLSFLDLDGLKKKAMYAPIEDVLKLAKRQGKMPLGLFGSAAEQLVHEKVKALSDFFEEWGVNPNEIFSIELKEQCKEPKWVDGSWQVPPLIIPYQGCTRIKIVGTFREVSKKGLIAHKKGERSDFAKEWPSFLIFNLVVKHYQIPIQPNLLLAKDGKLKEPFFEDPIPLLKRYFDYYFLGQQHASPLLPEWVEDLMAKPEQFSDNMFEKIYTSFQPMYNEYVKWTCRGGLLWDADSIMKNWKPKAEEVFAAAFDAWIAKRKKS